MSKYILKRQFLIAETLSKDLKARRHYFQKWGYYKSSSIQEIAHAITQIEWVFQRRTNLIHRFLAGHHAARARKRCSIAKKKLAIFSFKKFCWSRDRTSASPFVRPSLEQESECEMSHFLVSMGAGNLILHVQIVIN